MRDKIYTLIKKTFGDNILAFLPAEPCEDWKSTFVSNIFSASNSAELVEEILSADNEELYWLIWDEGGWFLRCISSPLPRTQAMLERWETAANEAYGSICHVSEEITTKRLRLIPMDGETAAFLGNIVEQEGKHEDFLLALECYDMPEKIYFSLIEKDTNEPVGYIGLVELPLWCGIPSENTFNMEYYVVPKKRKQGYLKEAGKAVIHAAFDGKVIVKEKGEHERILEAQPKKVKIIKVSCDTDNTASYKSALSMGFKEEGTLSLVRNGKIYKKHLLTKNK